MTVLETLQTKVVEEAQARIQQRELENAIQDAYPEIIGKLFAQVESMLQPVTASLENFDSEVANEVFSIQKTSESLKISLLDKVLVLRPAGNQPAQESPWTLFVEDKNHKVIDRLFLDRDDRDFYWTVLRGKYAERLSDQEIWEIIEKVLLAEVV